MTVITSRKGGKGATKPVKPAGKRTFPGVQRVEWCRGGSGVGVAARWSLTSGLNTQLLKHINRDREWKNARLQHNMHV